jgi:hypothetical protein
MDDEFSQSTRHNFLRGPKAKLAQAGVFWVTDDDVIEDFDFEKLPGAYQIISPGCMR